jgi:hypothetical protein
MNTISKILDLISGGYPLEIVHYGSLDKKKHHKNFYKLVLTFLICSIISEHIKSRLHAGRRPNTFFWRNSTGHEIDLIIEAGAQLWAFETFPYLTNLFYFNILRD